MFRGEDFMHIQGGEEIFKFRTLDITIKIAHDQEAISSRTPLAAGRLKVAEKSRARAKEIL